MTDRFFVHYYFEKFGSESYFENRLIGKNYFNSRLRDMCKHSGVTGGGVKEYITTNSLRATMIQWLLDEGHPATVIATRTGHRDLKSLHSYNHLHSEEGYNQQLSLFSSTRTMNPEMKLSSTQNFPVKKRKLEVVNDLPTSQHRNFKS